VVAPKSDFYFKASPPRWETLHNPVPASKMQTSEYRVPEMTAYSPYVGTLQNHITKLVESNGTVPPYNYAFVIYTVANTRKIDPRPRRFWLTELERVWMGPSSRYFPHNGSMLFPGTELANRNCTDFIYHGYRFSSPEICDFKDCDLEADWTTQPMLMNSSLRTGCPNTDPSTIHADIWEMWRTNETTALDMQFEFCNAVESGFATTLQRLTCCGHAGLCSVSCQRDNCVAKRLGADGLPVTIHPDHCCPETDAQGFLAVACDIGVAPTVCRNNSIIQFENHSDLTNYTWAPFPFRVINPPFVPSGGWGPHNDPVADAALHREGYTHLWHRGVLN